MISIKEIPKKDLVSFVESAAYKSLEFVPISPHRALSHYKNPRAQDDDIVLFLAYEGEELVGYLGALPDQLLHNNISTRIAWLSCLWINGQHRGKKIAYKLVSQAIEVWDQNILITEFTGPAKRLYDKTQNFTSLADLNGTRLYLRMSLAYLLPPKHHLFVKSKGLLKVIDTLTNGVMDLRFNFKRKKEQHLDYESIMSIDEEAAMFITARQEHQLFKRSIEDLNWILENPWIVDEKTGDPFADKYYFSSVAKEFKFIPIKVRDKNGRLVAVLIFAKRDNHLKLPYCYYDCDTKLLIKLINELLVKWKVSLFSIFHEELAEAIKNVDTPAIYKKEIKRNYIISKKLQKDGFPQSFTIQDGDADCSFT